jgi:coenzyme F420 hydrogenase subunit beta
MRANRGSGAGREGLECFDDLNYYVISRGLCTGCGVCAGICPNIEFQGERPYRRDRHDSYCGCCIRVCHQFYTPFSKIEKKLFGATRDNPYLGYYDAVFSARSTSQVIRRVCQDGGVVSTLSKYLLESGKVEGVLMAGVGMCEPLKPVPVIATAPEDVIGAAGSRYSVCPVGMGLYEASERGVRKIAVVGAACHVQGLRKIQMLSDSRFSFDVKAVIGIFCHGNFVYEDLFKGFVQGKLGINLEEVTGVKIRNNTFEIHRNHRVDSIPLNRAYRCVHKPCLLCRDFTAELSDLSVGAVGSEQGWNTVILRSERGRRLFQELVENRLVEASREAVDFEHLIRVARRKKQRVEQISQETTQFLKLFGLSEFEAKVYEFLILLHGPRLDTLGEVMHASPWELEKALESLRERGWLRVTQGRDASAQRYLPEKPETVVNREMKKLDEKLKNMKKHAVSELTASYVRKMSETDLEESS